jgi:hypothetical protein
MNNLDVAARRISRARRQDNLDEPERKPFHLRKAVQKVRSGSEVWYGLVGPVAERRAACLGGSVQRSTVLILENGPVLSLQLVGRYTA